MNTVSTHRRYFPRGPGLGLKTFVLAVCALAIMIADHSTANLQPLRAGLSWVLSPLLTLAATPDNALHAVASFKTRGQLEQENQDLLRKQFILEAKLSKYDALEAETHRIRELLASSKTLQERVLIAGIIAVTQDPYRHQITLDRGSKDGVYRGQALVDAYGILGQVIRVAPNTSQALLITDPDHGIPVEINRTGLQTIALGLGDGQGLKLPFLPNNADVRKGDLLVSSALGGRFPAGYPVGKIYSVHHAPGADFMEAAAYPSAKLDQGTQALLVWNTEPAVPPAPVDTPIDPGAAKAPGEKMPTREPRPGKPAEPQTPSAHKPARSH
ncbi:MAG TPA: rod shape-determining protein MreC [Stenotrophobium sp.]|nr:rod shape-determining protein MreC [Stenotrophobium sp.]